ncbi:MAG: CpaF family protein, partial [Candidatus Diapherotrites archaeon]|nr:CpaF family protein [Candidatus Diapherotrites archaeon]
IPKLKRSRKLKEYRKKKITAKEEEEILQYIEKRVAEELKINETRKIRKISLLIFDELFGLFELGQLLRDSELEEIMVNSPHKEVFVFHRKFGMCKTNIILGDKLHKIIERISQNTKFANRSIIDVRMNNGSRANIASSRVAWNGPSLTIRKFPEERMSIIDLIDNGTLSYEVAAFLWLAVEGFGIYPLNIIIAGSASSGKTTLLNSLLAFIPYWQRIISIEDVRELDLSYRENYVALEARDSVQSNRKEKTDMLLENAIRMRPDRIIVGEVRHAEAKTLFTAMNTGQQGILATIHANSCNDAVLRLTTSPMNVPMELMRLLDIVIFLKKERKGIETKRFVEEIVEFDYMAGTLLSAELFSSENSKLNLDTSHIIEVIAKNTGRTKNEVKEEIMKRAKILEWMHKNKITNTREVTTIIQHYYINPREIEELVNKLYAE